jgi:hypothetical protein
LGKKKKRATLVADQWADFLKRVVPTDAGPTQLRETRRAFYAGAQCLFVGILNRLESGEEETPADLELMADIEAEFQDFAEKIRGGNA